jgi:fructose-1,6-bisphosphatase/inositol monophosphatase family enzyme
MALTFQNLFDLFDDIADEIFAIVEDLSDSDRLKKGIESGHYFIDEIAQEIVEKHLYGRGAQIISEEAKFIENYDLDSNDSKEFVGLTFVVDPIDGSSNASRGLSDWSFSILVKQDGLPWLSFVKHGVTKQKFLAIKGKGAFINEVNNVNRIAKPDLGERGDLFISFCRESKKEHPLERFLGSISTDLLGLSNKHRILGSASIAISYVATGTMDIYSHGGFYLYGWDCLAALLFAQEAGCIIDIDGKNSIDNLAGDERFLVNVY